jgi:D-alanyl-D-alanine carboxypeptidase (penicillin-binding protein 5/6)
VILLRVKKIFIVLMMAILIVSINFNVVLADDDDEEDIDANELQQIVESSTLPIEEPTINSKSAIIYDRTTKKVIWGKNENTKRAMASTTKIMTAIVVLENADLTQTVTVSKKAANTGGSRLKLNTGDKITVNDLLYGLMLRSRK